MSLLAHLTRVLDRQSLAAADAEDAMDIILRGDASEPQIAAFLVALRMKGETAEELTGFARAMRQRAVWVNAGLNGEPLLDTCGTGGDGCNTFNISTIAAFVAAGAGARVAKHGNRSISGRCGSADLLEALGVPIAMEPEDIGRAIREVGIGFLFAPASHTAMKYAQPVRVDLKIRTVFNLLGPLTNPAGATRQLLGAPSPAAAELMARAMAALGLERGFVVHGSDGLDEITITGPTKVAEVRHGQLMLYKVEPEQFGLKRAHLEDISGGDIQENAQIIREILDGKKSARRDVVLLNAAAALVAAGKVGSMGEAMPLVAESLDSGAARKKLQALVEFTNNHK